ncbi:SHOCT domain-containing protein [bacterium]|nr:SHOCT domain-containing protein [bacterium]
MFEFTSAAGVLADTGWGHMGWGGGTLVMLGFWAVVIALLFVAFRAWGPTGGATDSAERSASDILDERYARGEIDETEYVERRSVLAAQR